MDNLIWIHCDTSHQGHWVEPVKFENGLAITRALNAACDYLADMFSVTHVESGLRIGEGYELDMVVRLFAALLPLTDWHKSAEELRTMHELQIAVKRVVREGGTVL